MKRIVFVLVCMLFSFSFSAPGKDRSFFFVQLSDPRLGLCSEDGGFEREKQQFKQFIDAINRLKPAFVVISGNLVNDRGNAAQLAGFRELCRRIDSKIPIYLLPGACDVGDEASPEAVQDFIGRYGSDRFVFRKEGCCVIGLNTPVVKAGNSGQRRQQYDWLEKQLRHAGKYRRRILIGHHPFFVNRPDEPDADENIPSQERQRYLDFCARYRVDLVLAGHLCRRMESDFNDTHFSVAGSAGHPAGKEKPGLQIVIVHPERIHAVYYEIDRIPSCVELFRH